MADEEQLLPAPPPTPPPSPSPAPAPPGAAWRTSAAFWLLGVANNLPYVLMLSAARDILQGAPVLAGNGSTRDCNKESTGAVLLADILPTLLIKLVAPLGIHRLPYGPRVITSCLCSWGSVTLVASGRRLAESLGGVALASAASGLGEVTLLALAAEYGRPALSAWASGTGLAGLSGALLYGALAGAGLPLGPALLPALGLPPVSAASFLLLLPPPPGPPLPPPPALPRARRWRVAKGALWAATPLGLVYFLEYLINQGLLDLLEFPSSSLTHNEQYRWFQLLYQSGVFVSRSSLRCLRLRRLWVLPLLQLLNAALLLAAVLVPFLPGVGVAFALVGWEGLLGGVAYGSSFLLVAEQAGPAAQALAVTTAALTDALGIALAGAAAMGTHRLLCPPK
ncbi:battenin [Caloenas nicobarica]|uniref:battenin n=1 Tax=Caloenas nicobarica TaxID=187106 RepID=UPI0032B729C5